MTMEMIRERGIQTTDGHDYVEFSQAAYDSQMRRFLQGTATRFRVSPDVAHMLVAGHKPAATLGFELICDASLPPDTVARVEAWGPEIIEETWRPSSLGPQMIHDGRGARSTVADGSVGMRRGE